MLSPTPAPLLILASFARHHIKTDMQINDANHPPLLPSRVSYLATCCILYVFMYIYQLTSSLLPLSQQLSYLSLSAAIHFSVFHFLPTLSMLF